MPTNCTSGFRTALTLALAGTLAACATIPPEEDPVLLKLTELERRLVQVERVVNNESLLDLLAQVEQLQGETRELRGLVETLEFQSNTNREQQRNLFRDLDERISRLDVRASSGPTVAVDPNDGALPESASGESDGEVYYRAFSLLQERSYPEAAAEFDRFLDTYPDSGLRADAFYWRAETDYVQQNFAAARDRFETMLTDFPQSRKVADALLKLGFCQYELKQYGPARASLQRVRREHAETTADRLAAERLEKMDDEGR